MAESPATVRAQLVKDRDKWVAKAYKLRKLGGYDDIATHAAEVAADFNSAIDRHDKKHGPPVTGLSSLMQF